MNTSHSKKPYTEYNKKIYISFSGGGGGYLWLDGSAAHPVQLPISRGGLIMNKYPYLWIEELLWLSG